MKLSAAQYFNSELNYIQRYEIMQLANTDKLKSLPKKYNACIEWLLNNRLNEIKRYKETIDALII